MPTVRELHERAMAWCDHAQLAKHYQHPAQYQAYLLLALPLEFAAAKLATGQPTRAILYRSAASIALEAGEYGQALVLARRGLEGAPEEIAGELQTVIEQAQQKRGEAG